MTRDEITEFKAQTARRRAAEAEHPTPDAAAHDRATNAGLAVIRDIDHAAALLEDRARHPFLPTMGNGPAWGACQMIGCGRPYADASAHTRTVLTATGVVTR
jgi:hypothetical protein